MQNQNAARFLFEPQRPKPPKLTITLRDRHRHSTPLDVLLEQALGVLNPPGSSKSMKAPWLARQALRAVCEGILEDNCLTLPVRIERPYKRVRRVSDGAIPFDFGGEG